MKFFMLGHKRINLESVEYYDVIWKQTGDSDSSIIISMKSGEKITTKYDSSCEGDMVADLACLDAIVGIVRLPCNFNEVGG